MIIPSSSPSRALLVPAAILLLVRSSSGAVIEIDWLNLSSGGTPSAFELVDDAAATVVTGGWTIDPGAGIAFSGYPRSRAFDPGFWETPIHYADSTSGNGLVTGFDVRTVPQGGGAVYRIEMSLPAGRQFILAVGGLYQDGGDATGNVTVDVQAGGTGRTVTLSQTVGWDNGVSAFDQAVDWSAGTQTLSPAAAAFGDSKLSFFDLGTSASPATLTIAFPDGYGSGVGDEISIALGVVAVPEPASWGIAAMGWMGILFRRRR